MAHPKSRFLLVLGLALSSAANAQELLDLPDGCQNPFTPSAVFGDFFEKAIRMAVVDAGQVNPAHVRLFGVNRLRKFVAEKYPNPADGDAIDQHIRAQICLFGEGKKLNSTSPELHRHLVSIAPRLLRDIRIVVAKVHDRMRAEEKIKARYEARLGLIERAERLGDEEVSALTK